MERYIVTTTTTEVTELYADDEAHALGTFKSEYLTKNRTTQINIVSTVEE